MAKTIKDKISYQEYLQLEGLFALLKQTTKKCTELEECVAEILGIGEYEDNYDGAYPLMDNVWDQDSTMKKILKKYKIKVKKR